MVNRDRRGRFSRKGRQERRERNEAERRDAPLVYQNDKLRRYVRRNNTAAGVYSIVGGGAISGYQLAKLSAYPKGTPGKRLLQGLVTAQGASTMAMGANTLYTTRKRTAPGARASKRDLRGDRNRALATTGAVLGSYGATSAYNRAARSGVDIGGLAAGARRYYKAKRGPVRMTAANRRKWRAGARLQTRNVNRSTRSTAQRTTKAGDVLPLQKWSRSRATRKVVSITTARRPTMRARMNTATMRRATARRRRRPGTSLVRVR